MKRTVDISLTGIFAALVALSYLVPISVIVGGIGVFSLSWVVQTITGILLGPYLGGGAALIGGVTGNFFKPSMLGPLAVTLPALGAFEAGLISWNHWRAAASLLGLLITAWFILPVGLAAWPAALFHILGLAIIIVLGRKLPRVITQSMDRKRIFLAWMLIAYCGDIARHMLGNILSATVLSIPPAIFLAVLPQAAVEQTLFAFASALVGVSTLFAVRSAGLEIPIMRLERLEDQTSESD